MSTESNYVAGIQTPLESSALEQYLNAPGIMNRGRLLKEIDRLGANIGQKICTRLAEQEVAERRINGFELSEIRNEALSRVTLSYLPLRNRFKPEWLGRVISLYNSIKNDKQQKYRAVFLQQIIKSFQLTYEQELNLEKEFNSVTGRAFNELLHVSSQDSDHEVRTRGKILVDLFRQDRNAFIEEEGYKDPVKVQQYINKTKQLAYHSADAKYFAENRGYVSAIKTIVLACTVVGLAVLGIKAVASYAKRRCASAFFRSDVENLAEDCEDSVKKGVQYCRVKQRVLEEADSIVKADVPSWTTGRCRSADRRVETNVIMPPWRSTRFAWGLSV